MCGGYQRFYSTVVVMMIITTCGIVVKRYDTTIWRFSLRVSRFPSDPCWKRINRICVHRFPLDMTFWNLSKRLYITCVRGKPRVESIFCNGLPCFEVVFLTNFDLDSILNEYSVILNMPNYYRLKDRAVKCSFRMWDSYDYWLTVFLDNCRRRGSPYHYSVLVCVKQRITRRTLSHNPF